MQQIHIEIDASQISYNHLCVIRKFGGKKLKRFTVRYQSEHCDDTFEYENVMLIKKLDKIMIRDMKTKDLIEITSLDGMVKYSYVFEKDHAVITMSEDALNAAWMITMEF